MGLALVIFLHGLLLLAVQGAVVPQVCSVKPSFQSPYITPFWEESTAVIGCSSRALAHRSQEVHVIYLKNDDPPGSGHVPVVTLNVKPLAEHSVHAGRLVIILHAQRTVSWRVVGERISNASHHTIVVTRGSQVIENNNLRILVMRRPEMVITRVITWVNRRFKAVTSYAEVPESNAVFLKVGIADNAPHECNLEGGLASPNVEAVYSELVPPSLRQGCVIDTLNRELPEVHVIHVHTVGRPPKEDAGTVIPTTAGQVVPIALDVRGRRNYKVEKNLILVLKAHQPVVWIVRSENLRGILKIVTEDPVERLHVPATQLIPVKTEELPENSDDLIFYADNKYGPLLSYLEVNAANKFQLLVDDNGMVTTQSPSPPPPPEVKLTRQTVWPSPRSPPSNVPNSKDFIKAQLGSIRASKSTGVQVLVKSRGRVSPEDLIRMPNVLLMDAMQVDCMPQYIQISFPRLTLERLGIHGGDMTLNDARCRVLTNETHFVLSTYFNGCGTETQHTQERVFYKNAVNFHFVTRKIASGSPTLFRESDLLVDDEDHNIENGSGAEQMDSGKKTDSKDDDDDNFMKPKTLEFQCEYLTTGLPVPDRDVSRPNSDRRFDVTSSHWQIYGLDLYRDPDYRSSVKPTDYPLNVVENEQLYVESRIDAGPHLRVVTEECWLSGSSNSSFEQRISLIRNACPTDISVQIERSRPPHLGVRQVFPGGGTTTTMRQRNHFSFQLNAEYMKLESVYMHCTLGVCTANPQHSVGNLKQCVDLEEYCVTNSLRPFLDQQVGTHHKVLSCGPIHIVPRQPSEKNFPTDLFDPVTSDVAKHFDIEGQKRGGCSSLVEALLSSLAPFLNLDKRPDISAKGSDDKIVIQEPAQVILIGLSTEAVVGIAFASFVIGAGLTAILWFIHLRTDPLRNNRAHTAAPHHSGYDLSAHSGSSTPSSQVPMTT